MADPLLDTDDPVWREALDWFLRTRQTTEDPQLKADLNTWLAASEGNRNAFEEVSAVWELTGHIAPVFQEEWQPKRVNVEARIATLPLAKGKRAARRVFLGVAGGSLAAVLAWLFLPALWITYRADHMTSVGEHRVIDLTDGSRLHLNTKTAVRVNLTGRERRIDLLDGEAFFEVSPDKARPFVVEAGAVAVRVLGTKFNVRLDAASATIAVAVGQVSVGFEANRDSEQFIAGQGAEIDIKTGQFRRSKVAADRVAPWQEGQLIVDNRTVSAVVAELRRYHRGFILLDNDLAGKTISGVYNLNDPIDALKAVIQPHRGQIRSLSPYLLVVSSR